MRITASRLILHYNDGKLQQAFAASVTGETARNILGTTFHLGRIIRNYPLTPQYERQVDTMRRGYDNAKEGKKLTKAQREAWGCCAAGEVIEEVEGTPALTSAEQAEQASIRG